MRIVVFMFIALSFLFYINSSIQENLESILITSSERALIKLPSEVEEILIGILLGDAHIDRRTSTSNSKLVYAQTAVAHKEYFDYVLSFFFYLFV